MKSGRALTLARRNVRRNLPVALACAFGVAVGVGCLVFFIALGSGITQVVRTRIFPSDAATVEVIPAQVSIGSLFGGGKIDDATLKRLAALPGVTEALPKMTLRVTAASWYDGPFFGHPLRMGLEIVGVGVDPKLVQSDVLPRFQFVDPGPGKPIPALINNKVLEIYNKSFAASRGLPQLSPEMLAGFHLPIEYGRSFVSKEANYNTKSGFLELAGFSDRALLGGVTLPLDAVRRINREYGQDAETYSSIVLRTTGPDVVPAITQEVHRIGFDVDDSEQKLSEQVGWGIVMVTGALGLLSVLISALAAVNIAHAFFAAVRERRREIGILRAVGASSRDVLRILLLEATLVGLGGGLVGVLAGRSAAWVVDFIAARYLPDFPYKPQTFFHFPPSLLLGALAVALIASVGGAFVPARRAARTVPAQALTE